MPTVHVNSINLVPAGGLGPVPAPGPQHRQRSRGLRPGHARDGAALHRHQLRSPRLRRELRNRAALHVRRLADDMAALLERDQRRAHRPRVHRGSMGSLVALRYTYPHADRVHRLFDLLAAQPCSDRIARLPVLSLEVAHQAYSSSRSQARRGAVQQGRRARLPRPASQRRDRRGRDGRRRAHGRRQRAVRRLPDAIVEDRPAARHHAGRRADAGAGQRD